MGCRGRSRGGRQVVRRGAASEPRPEREGDEPDDAGGDALLFDEPTRAGGGGGVVRVDAGAARALPREYLLGSRLPGGLHPSPGEGRAPEAGGSRDGFFDLLLELQRRGGRHSTIRFGTSSFTYGFDWAKRVGREPARPARWAPSMGVLTYLRPRHRAGSPIERDDRTYPTLVDDRPRNPSFRRHPEAEQAIFEAMAREGEPAHTWRVDAEPRWDRPFQSFGSPARPRDTWCPRAPARPGVERPSDEVFPRHRRIPLTISSTSCR